MLYTVPVYSTTTVAVLSDPICMMIIQSRIDKGSSSSTIASRGGISNPSTILLYPTPTQSILPPLYVLYLQTTFPPKQPHKKRAKDQYLQKLFVYKKAKLIYVKVFFTFDYWWNTFFCSISPRTICPSFFPHLQQQPTTTRSIELWEYQQSSIIHAK